MRNFEETQADLGIDKHRAQNNSIRVSNSIHEFHLATSLLIYARSGAQKVARPERPRKRSLVVVLRRILYTSGTDKFHTAIKLPCTYLACLAEIVLN